MKIKIYDLIKRDIIEGVLKPGALLEECELAKMYGVSRTPIREALIILKNEFWIEKNSRKGTYVSKLSIKLIKDIFQLRYSVEPLMLKFSFKFFLREELEEIKLRIFESLKNGDLKELSEIDEIFHEMLLMNSHNNLAINIMEQLQGHTKRLRNLTFKDKEETVRSAKEHIEIIDLILGGDLEKAIEKLERHIDNNQLYFVRNFELN